jgi:histidinol-phosphate phosphatase family protein
MTPPFDIVVPTVGRRSLLRLLSSLEPVVGAHPHGLIVVDDRGEGDLELPNFVRLIPGRKEGPASARDIGWRMSTKEWVVFLDDDVIVPQGWLELLVQDLKSATPNTAGVQGRVRVPLPTTGRLTDWERNVRGLETARWITADMAYRRSVLAKVGGFDSRFPRAYREDADLALRVMKAGYDLALGRRTVDHPVPPADRWVSLRKQAGVQDDLLMTALHGPSWRAQCGAPEGRKRWHLKAATCAALAPAARAFGMRRTAWFAAAVWGALTTELALNRIVPGPRSRDEIVTMLTTSAVMPFVVAWHQTVGSIRASRLTRGDRRPEVAAVLFDRDGTLVVDEPYNRDPSKVTPVPGAKRALDRLRRAHLPTAVVSNQSGVGRGFVLAAELEAVNQRIEQVLGPLGPWFMCTHAPEDGCACRKPSPKLVVQAAAALGVPASHCVLIGDIGSDVDAALAAGARAILVPTKATRPEEIAAAPEVARDLDAAVTLVLRSGEDV